MDMRGRGRQGKGNDNAAMEVPGPNSEYGAALSRVAMGTFADRHPSERYPLVGFYARPIAQALLACAWEARAGLTYAFYPSLMVFAEDLPACAVSRR